MMKGVQVLALVGVLLCGAVLRFGMSRSSFIVQTLANRFEVSTAASGAQRCLFFISCFRCVCLCFISFACIMFAYCYSHRGGGCLCSTARS